MKYEVTLRGLKQAGVCYRVYNDIVRAIRGIPFTEENRIRRRYVRYNYKKPISLLFILENIGIDDALWALRCVPEIDRDARLFAIWCARRVQYLMADPRSLNALDVAERFANGKASEDELSAAADAASLAAWDTTDDISWAASAAANAASESAEWSAWAAAWKVASGAEQNERRAQEEMFKLMCQGQAPWQTQG